MRVIFLVCSLVLLAGNAAAQGPVTFDDLVPYQATNLANIWAQNSRKATACTQMQLAKHGLKTVTALMHCIYDGYTDALRAVGAKNMDLVDVLVTGKFAIAEKIDHHQITIVEGEAEEAALVSRVDTDANLRLNATKQAAQAEQDSRQQAQAQAAEQEAMQNAAAVQQRAAQDDEAYTRELEQLRAAQALGAPQSAMPQMPFAPMICMPFGQGISCTQ